MFLQHSSFYLFGDFPMRLMGCCRAILVGMIFIIAGLSFNFVWDLGLEFGIDFN